MSDQAAALRQLLDDWAVPPAELVGKLPRAGIHLDYLGHAEVTRALIESDPCWTWEPLALTDQGTPVILKDDKTASMWMRLTVHGVTRVGVGTAPAGKPDVLKELVSDGLRNCAMRFGVGLSLWSKQEWDDHDIEAVSWSKAQAKGHVLEELIAAGLDRAEATARAAVLWENHGPRGAGPFPEADLADVFAHAAAEVKA